MESEKRNEMLSVYRAELPHGAMKKIAKKASVHPMSVTHFLKGRNKSYRIEKAVLEYIAELREERKRLINEAGLKQ